MKLITISGACLALLSTAPGDLLTATGNLDRGERTEFFGLTLPVPYRLSVEFDPAALDTDPSPTLGIYETEGATVRLEFGGYVFETSNSEVRVWSGEKGFYGFTCGNEDAFSAHGLNVGPYAIYLSILDAAHPSLAPTDVLKWVRSDALASVGAPYFFLANQDYLDRGPDPIRIQGGVDTLRVEANAVPEPRTWLLWLGGLVLCLHRRELINPHTRKKL